MEMFQAAMSNQEIDLGVDSEVLEWLLETVSVLLYFLFSKTMLMCV